MGASASRARYHSQGPGMADIVLPFYNQPHLLLRCLKSLQLSAARRNRLVLVDDGSEPRVHHLVEGFCRDLALDPRMLSHPENRGYKESIRTGLRECRDRHVILLNSDTVVTPDFDRLLLEVLEADEHVRAVAPVSNHPTDLYQFRDFLYERSPPEGSELYRAVLRRALQVRQRGDSKLTPAPYLTGMCLALDRDTFERAGGFGAGYRHGYFEDLALSCQLRALGHRLIIREDCFVFHEGHGTYKHRASAEKLDIIQHNFRLFSREWGHLPEHVELLEKMELAGKEHPI